MSFIGIFSNCNNLKLIDIRNFCSENLINRNITYIFLGRNTNGRLYYISKLFEEELINITFEGWEKYV